MDKEKITSSELLDLLKGDCPIISNYMIIDCCVINDNFPANIQLQGCDFNELLITCKKEKTIYIDQCTFKNLIIKGNIDRLYIDNLEKYNSIQVESGDINFIRINNSNIEKIEVLPFSERDKLNIKTLLFFANKINKVVLSGEIKECQFYGNYLINEIFFRAKMAELFITKEIYPYSNTNEEEARKGIIKELSIWEKSNSAYSFNKADFERFSFFAEQTKSSIQIQDCRFEKIEFFNNFSNDSNIFISKSLILDLFIFKKCKIPQMVLSNMDLTKTRFVIIDSFLFSLRWHNVKWSSDIKYYRYDDCDYNSLDTLRLLKLTAMHLEDIFNKVNFQHLEFTSITDSIRGSNWNNGHIKLKWFLNPFRDFYLIFRPNSNFNSIDKIIFYLNKYSNNYGLDPLRGVLFTLGIAFFFFLLYVVNLTENEFQWGWKGFYEWGYVLRVYLPYYCEFIYAAHSSDFMCEFKPNAYASIFDVMGRIFVGYGYYQTIRAFRKYAR